MLWDCKIIEDKDERNDVSMCCWDAAVEVKNK